MVQSYIENCGICTRGMYVLIGVTFLMYYLSRISLLRHHLSVSLPLSVYLHLFPQHTPPPTWLLAVPLSTLK